MRKLMGLSLAGPTLAWALASAPAAAEEQAEGTTYRVYFMGGQSNMDGYGYSIDLPEDLQQAREDIRIFAGEDVEDGKDGGGEGLWASLSPGFGAGFSTNGSANTVSDRFGPELTFGHAMADGAEGEGGANIAIIKFSRGGTSLIHGVSGYGSWDPGFDLGNRRNLYDQALTTIRAALTSRDIDGDGIPDRLVPAGIVWMQGEADAFDDWASATNYAANLGRLMTLFRAALHDDDLPIVIGRIQDSGDTAETRVMQYSPQVRAQQARFAQDDVCARMVTVTQGFGFIDGWHYRSQDYIDLGNAFAGAMQELEQGC